MDESMQIQVGVKVLLRNKDGKYLLVRRSSKKYPEVQESWDIVGGRIKPGSPLLENLKREVKEETRLNLIGSPKLIAAQDILRIEGRHVVRLTYLGETEGDPVLDEENIEYKWVSFFELQALDNLDIYLEALIRDDLLKER